MTDPAWLAEIETMIYKSWEGMHWGTYEAAKLGQEGESILVRAVRDGDSYVQSSAAEHLARMSSPESLALLRERARAVGKGAEGTRREALYALAFRLGEEAEPDLLQALRDPTSRPLAKDGATFLLGLWGRGSGWDEVLSHTKKRARVKTRTHNPWASVDGFPFLIRFCEGDDVRIAKLVAMLRAIWTHLKEHEVEWFTQRWPEVQPDGPDPADLAVPDITMEIERLRTDFVADWELKPPPVWTRDPFDRNKWPTSN
jgi:hypothetical protein